jgi:hypothetical protein
MFVRYTSHQAAEGIGLIVGINANQRIVSLRCFMSWVQLCQHVGHDILDNLGISFWPMDHFVNPPFLCDTDAVIAIPVESIQGPAFVFHVSDPILDLVQGMKDTYQVSSVYSTSETSISHHKSFFSFPSLCLNNLLPTCFPSALLKELLIIKQKVQCILNTRSMNGKCSQITHINNINYLTWMYMIHDLPCDLTMKNVIVKRYFFRGDESVLRKERVVEQAFELTLPAHLFYAQRLFGTAAGVGTRSSHNCRLKQKHLSARAEDHPQDEGI